MSKVKKAAHAEHEATRRATAGRDTWPVRLAGAASEAADQPPLVVLSLATATAGVVLRRGDVARAGLRMLAAHALATGIKTLLKTNIDRTRPAKALEDGHHVGKGRGAGDSDYNSFPSGHTAGAVAVAEAMARDLPGAAIPARGAALLAAAVQVPRGKHYLSDVAAGAAIGWASERAVTAAFGAAVRAWRHRRAAHGSITDPVLPERSAAAPPRR